MTRTTSRPLGKLSAEQFLKTYWQKEPVVIRAAFPNLKDPHTPDELAGLACEPHVNSRLVMERGGKRPWQVTPGPHKPETLRRLPRSHWTLLIESVDRHSPEIAAFASAFSFLPKWRMDDVMVSLAPNHGTVDAHIDSYDVFLIQGQGRRRWEVDRRARADYRPGLDLRILERFRAEDSWNLGPGDMLYVPPGVGHRGVTLQSEVEIALTYSIGFRAPSAADLLSGMLARALASDAPRLFSDAGRNAGRDPAELTKADGNALRAFLVAEVGSQTGDAWTLAAGEAVTSGGGAQTVARRMAPSAVARRLSRGSTLSPTPRARISWAGLERGRAAMFVNGESQVLSRDLAFAARILCSPTSALLSRRLAGNADLVLLIANLLRSGAIEWSD